MKKSIILIMVCDVLLLTACGAKATKINLTETASETAVVNALMAADNEDTQTPNLFTGRVDYTVNPTKKFEVGKTIKVTFKFWQMSDYPFENVVAKAKINSNVTYSSSLGYDSLDKSKANLMFAFCDINGTPGTISFKFVNKIESVEFSFYEMDAKTPLYDVHGYPLKCDIDFTKPISSES